MFGEKSKNENLLNVLEKLTGLVFVYGDGLPRNESCSSCCSRAKHFSESGNEVVLGLVCGFTRKTRKSLEAVEREKASESPKTEEQ